MKKVVSGSIHRGRDERSTRVSGGDRHRDAPDVGPQALERLAAQALEFLAAEPERLDRFFALSGLDGATLRAAAAGPGFFESLLDHIAGDEALFVAFAAATGQRPETLAAVRAALAPRDPDV